MCGKTVKSIRRHLKKSHGLYFPTDNFAVSFIKLYKIFRRAGYRFPFASPSELSYEDFINILENASKIFRFSKRAIVLFEPYLQYFAYKYSEKILKDFPKLAVSKNRIMRALAFVTLTFVPSEEAVPLILRLCTKKRSRFLKYIVYILNKYKDSVFTHVKRLIESRGEYSFSCIMKSLFIVTPERFYDALQLYISTLNAKDIPKLYDEFSDLFEYVISFPKRYFQKKNLMKALSILANIKFFRSVESRYSDEEILHYTRIYLLIRTMDDLWSRLYFGCQQRKTYMIKNEILGRSVGGTISSFLIKIAKIIERYPESCTELSMMGLDEYLDVADEIEIPYIQAYFLYVMADINTKNGNLEIARNLIAEIEKRVEWNYDFLPHAYLLGALIAEFLGMYENAQEYYFKIEEIGEHWEKELLDKARLNVLMNNYTHALEILNRVSDVPYKHLLVAYVADKLGDTAKASKIMSKLKSILLTDDAETAFLEIQALERICYCLYDLALEFLSSNQDVLQNVLDIQAMTCSRHFRRIVNYAYNRDPDNELAKYFKAVILLLQGSYREANDILRSIEPHRIERFVYLINSLFAAIMAKDKPRAEKIASELMSVDVDDENKVIALIHYFVFVGDYARAMSILRNNRNLIDYELYLKLKKQINHKKLSDEAYTYYITSRRLYGSVCPLLSIKLEL